MNVLLCIFFYLLNRGFFFYEVCARMINTDCDYRVHAKNIQKNILKIILYIKLFVCFVFRNYTDSRYELAIEKTGRKNCRRLGNSVIQLNYR